MSSTPATGTALPVTLRFRLSFLDSARAVRAVVQARRGLRLLRRAAWLLVVGGFVTAVASERLEEAAFTAMLLGLLVVIIFWLSAPFNAWLSRMGSPLARAEQVWVFDTDSIVSDVGATRSVLSWSAITRIVETRRFLLIFFSDQAHCPIPKRAFSTPVAIATIHRLYGERQSSAAGGTRALPDIALGEARMRVSFTWTLGTLYRASLDSSKKGIGLLPFYLWALGIGALLSGPDIVRALRAGAVPSLWSIASLLLPAVLTFAFARLGGLWWAYSHLRSSRVARTEQVVEVFDTAIVAHGSAYNAVIPFDSMTKVVETADFMLFYISKAQALTVPRAALTADQPTWLKEFLAEKFGDKFIPAASQ